MISAARLRPFPWASLDSTTKAEADALRELRRWFRRHVRLDAVGSALSGVLRADASILVRRTQPLPGARGMDDAIGVLLSAADAPNIGHGALLEIEPALAASVVARCVERSPPAVVQAGAALSPGVAGAVGAIVAATARRAHAETALRVVAAGPARALEADLARLEPELLAVTATVLIELDAFLARLVVPRRIVGVDPPSTWCSRDLVRALGPVRLPLPIVACATRARVADVASLQVGDVWVPGAWPLKRGPDRGIVGPVLLAAPGSDLGVRAELGDDGRLVLRGQTEALCAPEPEAEMGESVEKSELIEAVGEVPVVVRVEIGEARMAAREWASLGRGDVLALGRRIGEPVILRVGGVPVARGDLVEIDGEVGVRIVERVAAAEFPQ